MIDQNSIFFTQFHGSQEVALEFTTGDKKSHVLLGKVRKFGEPRLNRLKVIAKKRF